MNRARKRKLQRDRNDGTPTKSVAGQADFSGVPLATMCQSIQLLINELYQRGYPVYDFDNKDKFIQGIQIIKGKVFFLAAKGEFEHEKV